MERITLVVFLALWTLQVEASRYEADSILLNDGYRIPTIGLGTWFNVTELDEVAPSVKYGIEVGFRFLDTAHLYANEGIIGEVLSDLFYRGVVKREDMFISTKIDAAVSRSEDVIPALRLALKRLCLGYVDMYLIHTPYNPLKIPNYDFLNVWRGMEDAKKMGLTRSIGISNFNSTHVNRLLNNARIRPAVNEIEVNPTYTNLGLVAYCQRQGIVVIAYAPNGQLVPRPFVNLTNPPTFNNPTLVRIARKYRKNPSQVVLRHLIDRGTIPIPRSHNRGHILSNVDVLDFSLTQKEVYSINELNIDVPAYPNDISLEAAYRMQYELVRNLNLV